MVTNDSNWLSEGSLNPDRTTISLLDAQAKLQNAEVEIKEKMSKPKIFASFEEMSTDQLKKIELEMQDGNSDKYVWAFQKEAKVAEVQINPSSKFDQYGANVNEQIDMAMSFGSKVITHPGGFGYASAQTSVDVLDQYVATIQSEAIEFIRKEIVVPLAKSWGMISRYDDLRNLTLLYAILDCTGTKNSFTRLIKFIKIDPTTHCWNWIGTLDGHGDYGKFYFRGKLRVAHRFVWENVHGSIPDGKEIHHVCRNKLCCNPDHLLPVTRREHNYLDKNVAGINARKTHCIKGHPLSGDNLYISPTSGRGCKQCIRERGRRNYVPRQRVPKTHCKNGHLYSQDNLYINSQGNRRCKKCVREQQRSRYMRKRMALGKEVRQPYTEKSQCKNGHKFTPENTRFEKHGYQICKTCNKNRCHEYFLLRKLRTSSLKM